MAADGIRETRTIERCSSAASALYLLVIEHGSSFVADLPRDGIIVVGRDADLAVQLKNDAASRRHAQITLRDGRAEVTDLGSRNGTRLNGEPLSDSRPLASGDVVGVGEATLVLHAVERTSPRTSLLDPEALKARLAAELERAARYERPVAVLALSVRNAGRSVTTGAAALLRPIDVAGLAADGYLIAVMPELRIDEAAALATRIAGALGRQGLSVRGGVAGCPADGCDADTLLAMARAAAAVAEDGGIASAGATATRLQLGERTVLLAEPAMIRLYELIRRLAQSQLPVLISGETGAGKENAAFAIHHFSTRADQPFVAINCAALPEALAESELFGHEKGAFTGATVAKPGRLESADRGTVFLDELGELPLAIQAKLLRALEEQRITRLGAVQDRPIDVRIVAATNRRLEAEVAAGRFREDLFFRLSAATVVLPPLRDRPREIALLARAFLAAAAGEGRAEPELSAGAMRRLTAYGWPGNVRELRNTMEYLVATAGDDLIDVWHLPEKIAGAGASAASGPMAPAAPAPLEGQAGGPSVRAVFRPIADELRTLERRRMEEALAAAAGNQTRAASLIAMPLRTFVLKRKQYGIIATRGP